MFRWTRESIEWYINAVEYTQYPSILCEQLKEFFERDDIVCDIGCGLGYIDLLLSSCVKRITGVDVDADVLKLMEQNIRQQHITNVKTLHADWKKLKGNVCDIVLACSSASLKKDLAGLMALCRKRLILVKRNVLSRENGFITEYNLRNGSNKDEEFLEEQGILYSLKTFIADFGQPFEDEKEARKFIAHYKLEPWKSIPNYSLEAYLLPENADTGKRHLEHNNKYRYYLPNHKEVHIIVIDKQKFE